MEFKGTKEEMYEVGGIIYCQDTFNSKICEMSEDQTFSVNDANAKLFMAAPELLEALQKCLSDLKNGCITPASENRIIEVESAINKALK